MVYSTGANSDPVLVLCCFIVGMCVDKHGRCGVIVWRINEGLCVVVGVIGDTLWTAGLRVCCCCYVMSREGREHSVRGVERVRS